MIRKNHFNYRRDFKYQQLTMPKRQKYLFDI